MKNKLWTEEEESYIIHLMMANKVVWRTPYDYFETGAGFIDRTPYAIKSKWYGNLKIKAIKIMHGKINK